MLQRLRHSQKKKRPDGTHNITLDDEVDISECDDADLDEFETSLQIVKQNDMLNKSFRIIRISTLKTHAGSKTTKIKAACDNLKRGFKKQKKIVKDILKLPDNSQLDTKEIVIEKHIKKADDFDRLMLLIKDKLNDN